MTANDDLERRIADYYRSEPMSRAPDRVLAEALTTIESTPQRRGLTRVPWRFRPLNTQRLAMAAVAILAMTALAVARLLPNGGVGTTPTTTPPVTSTALTSPTPGSSPGPAIQLPEDGAVLAPGRYAVTVRGAARTISFTIGNGSWTGNGWYINDATSSISFWSVANVYADPCDDSSLPEPPIGPTVDDLVAALDAQPGTDMERLPDSIVDGRLSTRVVMHPSSGVAATCSGDLKLWQTGDRISYYRAIGTTESVDGPREVVWIVDVNGFRDVIVASYRTSDPVESASVVEIIDSITFGH